MTPADAAEVLTKAAAFDQRTIGRADAIVWAEALDDVELVPALEAVTRHYRESDQRLMPAHVRRHVEQMRRDRVRAALEQASTDVGCHHGTPGGDRLHPVTGQPICPMCRAAYRPAKHGDTPGELVPGEADQPPPIDVKESPDA